MRKEIFSIIVAYNSDIDRLSSTLNILSKQCRVVVVDNSTVPVKAELLQAICNTMQIPVIALGGNYGIAYAQNKGVKWAINNGSSDILLMDDDSVPSTTLVEDLLRTREKFSGPVVVSARAIENDGTEVHSTFKKNSSDATLYTELMSSGTLIPADAFDVVGFFDESLFIDCVDYEWGWRARSKGYSLYISKSAFIRHKLGEGRKLFLRMPSPIRHYYQFRNVLKMIVASDAPIIWRISQSLKLPVKLILIALFADFRINRLKYAGKGIFDFFKSRVGKFDL